MHRYSATFRHFIGLFTFFLLLFGFSFCQKTNPIEEPTTFFTATLDNRYNGLGTREAAWLSSENGEVLAFSWLTGNDTTQLRLSDALVDPEALLDLTVFRMFQIVGQGVSDTFITVRTFTGLRSGQTARLADNIIEKKTIVNLHFPNATSIDSLVVPDGLLFAYPQPANNFMGKYLCNNTGQVWFRIKANGEQLWRFGYLNMVGTDEINLSIADITTLPILFDPPPKTIGLPFTAYWNYDIQAATDLNARKFLPLGDIVRPPGGALPNSDALLIYEPPIGISKDGYRITATATDVSYRYYLDKLFTSLPTELPTGNFSVEKTALAGTNRLNSAFCNPPFDALVFTKNYSLGRQNAVWEAYLPPAQNGVRTYRLPDFPKEVAAAFPLLASYPFSNVTRARAEEYEKLQGYNAFLLQVLKNDNLLWKAENGFLGKEISF